MPGLRPIVDPPAFTPLGFGLSSVVEARFDTADPHWRNGVMWEPLCPSAASTYDECVTVSGNGTPPPPPAKSGTVDHQTRGATPFGVYAEYDCAAPGMSDDLRQLGIDALTRVEWQQVEQAFWTGQAGTQPGIVLPHLAADTEIADTHAVILQTAAEVATGATYDLIEGLGVLEGQLGACSNGVGIIHAPMLLGPPLSAWGLIARDGNRLRTLNGNLVALGAGYPGTAPDGTDAPFGTTWMYATGAVFAYRSAVAARTIPDSLDRANNTIRALAERTYLLGWDCCHAAVRVSTGGVIAGQAASSA